MRAAPWLPPRRAVRGAVSPVIDWQPVDANGDPANPGDGDGDVTVVVTRGDGTAVSGVGAVTGFGSEGKRQATLPVAAVGSVDWLLAVWSLDGTAIHSETVEVVGGTIGSYASLVEHAPNMQVDASRELVHLARLATEDTATRIMGRSPFPRFYRETVDGSGNTALLVRWPDLIEVVWARYWTTAGWTSLTSSEIADCAVSPAGIIERRDGAVWPRGCQNVEVGYRFGWESVPNDLRVELARAVQHKVGQISTNSSPMDRATSMSTFDGMNVTVATPGQGRWSTGLPDVDEKLNSYKFQRVGIA